MRHNVASRRLSIVILNAMLLSIAAAIVLLAADPAEANYPGENGKIAFTSDRTGNFEIYTANPDGTGVEQLTNTPNADDFTPAFSPDGTKIAFPRYPTNEPCCPPGDWGIFIIDLADGTETQITSGSGRDWDPYWSPDGTKLVFVRTSSGGFVDNTSDLYVANADGSGTPQALTSGGSYEIQPSWSPDGQKIVYTDGRDTNGGNGNIYILNANGGGSVKLNDAADFGSVDQSPAWSPDGTKIAWSRQSDIYVTNADNTGGTQQLTSGPDGKGVGDYSPDGTKIAYDCNNGDLCVMNADGSGQTNITNTPGGEGNIAWGPKPVPSDTTKPTLDLPSDITEEATGPSGSPVTYNAAATDDVDDNVPVDCSPASGNTFPIGTTQVNCSASDAAGNQATGSFNVTVRDTTAPSISGVPADITKTTTSASGVQVSYASPTANDAVDGGVPVNCQPASGSTFALGETTVSCSASDAHTNTATKTFKVSVHYDFGNGTGGSFAEPVTNGALNQVKAGAGVPVKFGLGGDLGLDIFAAGYPTSRKVTCDTQEVIDPIEQTVAVSSSGLKYEATSAQYIYSWKTDKAWSNTCRQLVIKLKDGSEHPINFKFK